MKKSSLTAAEGLRTWQEIGQHAAADRALSAVARRNRLVRWVGWGATLVGVALLLIFSVWTIRRTPTPPSTVPARPAAGSLRKFEFTTDGVLTEGWVRDFLQLHPGDSLERMDLLALRRRLLSSLQVSEAQVERVLPGTLRVSVKERHPVLRVATDSGMGNYKVYLLARDGVVFAGEDFPEPILNRLPWMAGLALHRGMGDAFLPVAGLNRVADLLAVAHARAAPLMADWTVVDLSEFDPRPQAPLSLIKVQSGKLGELTFLEHNFDIPAGNFDTQVSRLVFAVQQLQDKPVPMLIRGLDLSVANQAIVQPITLAASPPTRRAR